RCGRSFFARADASHRQLPWSFFGVNDPGEVRARRAGQPSSAPSASATSHYRLAPIPQAGASRARRAWDRRSGPWWASAARPRWRLAGIAGLLLTTMLRDRLGATLVE